MTWKKKLSLFDDIELQAKSPSSGDSMMEAVQRMQEMAQAFNQQYQALARKMQSDNRMFIIILNIMKEKHETARKVINNIR